jgi:ketosteroid isomerase-like protein
MPDPNHLALANQLIDRWNAGDVDGVIELYTDDAVMRSGPDWPEQAAWHGHDGIRRNIEEWRTAWESSALELDGLESYGNRAVVNGAWNTRGRASGVDGLMPFVILMELRGGKIASVEWFTDHDAASRAARDA